MTIYYRSFDFGAWLDEAELNKDARRTMKGSSHLDILTGPPCEFNGRVSYAGAVDLARNGWPEGRAKMDRALALASGHAVTLPITAQTWDVAGERPDVPLYCAGDPASMITMGEDASATRPVLRVMVEGWNSAYVQADQMERRGAAILAQVDAIEAADIRCELVLRFASHKHRNGKGPLSGIVTDVLLKRADEPLDLDRAAFVLVHPASLRRLHFREMETASVDVANCATEACGYPSTAEERNYKRDEFPGSIVIPSANENTDKYNRADTAARQIGDYFIEGLRELPHAMRCDGLAELLEERRSNPTT